MTDDSLFDEAITTDESFERLLTALIAAARRNDVDVSGAWECRLDDGGPNWEAIITALARTDGEG